MEWNSQLEKVISEQGEKCLSYFWLHDRAEKKYNSLDVWVNVPVIVLSTLAGSASIGSESLFKGFDQASVIIGIVSIMVGILNTLGSYFSWSKRSEGHKISSISYNKAYNFIKIELSLPRNQRTEPSEFLKLIKNELERLKEISPQIPDSAIREYNLKFADKYVDVGKPTETNGLDKIQVYSEEVEMRRSIALSNLSILSSPNSPQAEPEKEEDKTIYEEKVEEKPKSRPWK